MKNLDTKYAMEYHEATKHSEASVRMSHRYLDWENKPLAFKVYVKSPIIPLNKNFSTPDLDALTCISSVEPPHRASAIDITILAQLLFFSAGLTREMRHPLGTHYMRAASATGALYPIELYVICQDIPGLRAGIYHLCPADFTLTELRAGDFRDKLSKVAGGNPSMISSPVTIAFTSMAWRNAWKYEARSYRHWFWDCGVIAANLLATAVSAGLPTHLIMGFDDSHLGLLLGLEQEREGIVALAAIGIGVGKRPEAEQREVEPIKPHYLQLSKREVNYPEIWRIHGASSLANPAPVKAWVDAATDFKTPSVIPPKHIIWLEPRYGEPSNKESIGQVILKRGSTRRFARAPVSFKILSTMLHASTRGVPADFLPRAGSSIVQIYFIANAIENLIPGAYYFNKEMQALEQLKSGELRYISGYLCLEQPLFSDASAVFFLMTDLKEVLKHYGNRGYRAAQFEAGVIAGKIYLSAYSLGIGASGSTFYDDAVTEFFSPHAENKSTMIAVGIGIPAYKTRPGRILVGRLTREQLLREQRRLNILTEVSTKADSELRWHTRRLDPPQRTRKAGQADAKSVYGRVDYAIGLM